MTKYQLFALLATDRTEQVTINGITGILTGIEREDGSGHCFNLKMNVDVYGLNASGPVYKNVFVRTID